MRHRVPIPHIGLRTLKTTAAITISMMLVYFYGTTESRYIFAMLGAIIAIGNTFTESLEACLTQFVGVFFGALLSILLVLLPIHDILKCTIGILVTITMYNMLHIRLSPSLPCMLVVIMCTSPGISPIVYAGSRLWDTAIGMIVGLLINTLVFPYDNSRRIHDTMESLDKEVLLFMEEMFDGDSIWPEIDPMVRKIDEIEQQLRIFSKQKLFLQQRKQHDQLTQFRRCDAKARELLAQMEVLCHMENIGALTDENRAMLTQSGANIQDQRSSDSSATIDIVTNYHVTQILQLRNELIQALKQ